MSVNVYKVSSNDPLFDENVGHQLFNAIMQGSLIDLDGSLYKRKVHHLPTQCGGRAIELTPSPKYDLMRVTNPEHFYYDREPSRWPDTGLMPCGENGLLYFNLLVPRILLDVMKASIQAWCDELGQEDGKVVSHNYAVRKVTELAPPNTAWVTGIIAIADEYRHDTGSEGREEFEVTCDECGDLLNEYEDYYCPDCDWYTSAPESDDGPYEDFEADISLHCAENWAALWNKCVDEEILLDRAESCELDKEVHHTWQYRTYYQRVGPEGTLNTACNAVARGRYSEAEAFDILDWVKRNAMTINERPVVISSNMADPHYLTDVLMADIVRNTTVLDNYGIGVLTTDTCATNPNERDHYISGILLYTKNSDLVNRYLINE